MMRRFYDEVWNKWFVKMSGVNIFRLANGKVVEIWNHRDNLGMMQ